MTPQECVVKHAMETFILTLGLGIEEADPLVEFVVMRVSFRSPSEQTNVSLALEQI